MTPAHALTHKLGGRLAGARLRHSSRRQCRAVGWEMHEACVDHGALVCPACGQPTSPVRHPTLSRVVVIGGH